MATTQLSARILVEASPEDMDRIRLYVIGALKASCRHIREGAVAISLFDESEVMIGMDVSGQPSEVMQSLIEETIYPDHDQEAS